MYLIESKRRMPCIAVKKAVDILSLKNELLGKEMAVEAGPYAGEEASIAYKATWPEKLPNIIPSVSLLDKTKQLWKKY